MGKMEARKQLRWPRWVRCQMRKEVKEMPKDAHRRTNNYFQSQVKMRQRLSSAKEMHLTKGQLRKILALLPNQELKHLDFGD